jgi:ferrous iron transport protein B
MYALGIVIAVLAGALLSRTVLPGDKDSAFVLELPPYRMPAFKGLMIHTWERSSGFVKKAGTLILAVTVILWFALNLPWGVENQQDSLFGRTSAVIAPAFAPLGFGNWQAAGSLMSGFIAKEIVVSTMSQTYGVADVGAAGQAEKPDFAQDLLDIVTGFFEAVLNAAKSLVSIIPGINLVESDGTTEDTALGAALRSYFSPLAAVAFVAFVLLYVPCVAMLAAIRHEYGSRWTVFATGFQLALAWFVAFAIYQGGKLLGMG